MATTKLTITLPDDQLHSIHALVAAGKARSVSGFVQNAVAIGLFEAAGWNAMLNDALRQTGGPLTPGERKWADELLEPPRGKRAGSRSSGKHRAA